MYIFKRKEKETEQRNKEIKTHVILPLKSPGRRVGTAICACIRP